MTESRKRIRGKTLTLGEQPQNSGIHRPYGPYERYFKRPLDVTCALAGLLLFWWLYLLVALLVRAKMGRPVLFIQERPGKDGRVFRLYKFRTMTDARDAEGKPLADEVRLTGFGKWLRSTSLDELPELFNILKGDMSLVGPRPLLVEYLPLYSEAQRRRHDVRPGLTGYAQVHGRNATAWEERLRMDVAYTEHITFRGDVRIMLETVVNVLKREGITSGSAATMEVFRGNGHQI